MKHFIYSTTNLINGMQYIGMHSTKNLKDGYIGSGRELRHAIKNHGKQSFQFNILAFCDTRQQANELEQILVDKQWVENSNTYNNQTGGGNGLPSNKTKVKMSQASKGRPAHNKGKKHTAETIAKMSQAHKNRSAETRDKLSKSHKGKAAWNKGKSPNAETRAKMRYAKLGKKMSPEAIEKTRLARIGKPLSDETKEKIRQKLKGNQNSKGVKPSEETRQKLRQAQLGKKHTPETKAKLSKINKGRKITAEHIEKLRQVNLGKKRPPFSAEHRAKLSRASKIYWQKRNSQNGATRLY